MIRVLTLLTVIFLTTACQIVGGGTVRPLNPAFMPSAPQGGPEEFQQGWKDGCDTGMAQHGTDIYRTSYSFTQNPRLVLNPAYYKAWKDAENYCRTYVFEYASRSFDVWCSLDGLSDECGQTDYKSGVPFLGDSPDNIGYNFLGNGDVGDVMGGSTSGFLGDSGSFDSLFGDW